MQQAAGGSWDNPDQFSGVLVLEEGEGGRRGLFSVVAPRDPGTIGTMVADGARTGQPAGVRSGAENELARLNLGVLLQWEAKNPGRQRRALDACPG